MTATELRAVLAIKRGEDGRCQQCNGDGCNACDGTGNSWAAPHRHAYEAAPVLLSLWEAVQVWREAKCERTEPPTVDELNRYHEGDNEDLSYCSGDNHIETCAVKLALDDVIALSNKALP